MSETMSELQFGNGCLVIAEVAQAHDGSLGTAHAYIDAAAEAGADAVKFQTHIAAAESTPSEPWRVKFSPQDATRYEYWKRMEFTEVQWRGLRAHADERGLLFISSPFSLEAVELLRRVGVAAWKVASGEVTTQPMLNAMAETGRPVLLSTGMSTMEEIDEAVVLLRARELPFVLMQCTSMYPTPPKRVGLNILSCFRERYDCPVGLSDHSGTIYPGLAAAVLGASIVEVHVTLSRQAFGPDVSSSLTFDDLHRLVEGVRAVEIMQAHPVDKDAVAAELSEMRRLFSKSIVPREDLPKGTILAAEKLTFKKPGTGISAARLTELIGRRLRRDVRADHMIVEADLEDTK